MQYIDMQQIINIWNNNDKDKESYIMYLDANNLHGWAMSAASFASKKKMSEFNENLIENHDENSSIGHIVNVEYPKRLYNFHNDLPFLPERTKIKNAKSLYAICTQ